MVFSNKSLLYIIAIFFAGFSNLSFANSTNTLPVKSNLEKVETKILSEEEKLKEEINEIKAHHVLDAHDFSLFHDSKS
ncbi:MAG: hypothetical protein H7174_08105, partial [Flavobacterium sp.]|nr:hypothetical protein [Flavobacterium sp.]